MSIHQVFSNPNTSFLPAALHKTNSDGWQVVFYALNPQTQKLERCRMKINKIKKHYQTAKEANLHAQEILFTINQKLKGGWSPFFEGEDSRLYEGVVAVCDKFIAEKEKILRKNTLRSYVSVTKQLIAWANENYPNIYFSMFNQGVAVRFMDYIFAKKSVGVRTYNNILKIARAVWNWAKEKCYTKENPFENLKLKPKQRKTRILVPPETR